jgi:riboflavin synthase
VFTGIVEELGVVVAIDHLEDAARVTIGAAGLDDVVPGASVAVNGVCLTAVDLLPAGFTADVMSETLRRSTLGGLAAGDQVNLERAVTPQTRLGGHIVQGHVDGVAAVVARRPSANWTEVDLDLPSPLARFVVMKGSITVDGVSLTVSGLDGSRVTVSLIPETLARTTLGMREVGTSVNIEVDVLAKYVERLLMSAGEPAAATGTGLATGTQLATGTAPAGTIGFIGKEQQ